MLITYLWCKSFIFFSSFKSRKINIVKSIKRLISIYIQEFKQFGKLQYKQSVNEAKHQLAQH